VPGRGHARLGFRRAPAVLWPRRDDPWQGCCNRVAQRARPHWLWCGQAAPAVRRGGAGAVGCGRGRAPAPAIGFGPVPKQQFGRWAAGKLFVIRGQGLPLWAGTGNAARFPACARRCPADQRVRDQQRPAPDPAGAKRPPGAGRALAGGFGPRLAWGRRSAVAGAMAPARETGHPEVRRNAPPGGTRKRDPRFPACAERSPADRRVREQQKASARPGGGEAPAGGGSGAGRGLWPPAGPDPGVALWQGRWPLPLQRLGCPRPSGRDQETRPAFPRPRATVPCRLAAPGTTKGQRPTRRGRSARRGRVGRWPGALAPGWSRISVALWQGRWPLPMKRCQCFRPSGRDQETQRASSSRARRCPANRKVQEQQKASARTGGREVPAGGGSGAGRGRVGRWPGALAPGWS